MEEVRRLTPELVMIKRPSDKPFEKPSHEDLQPLRNLIDGGVKYSQFHFIWHLGFSQMN